MIQRALRFLAAGLGLLLAVGCSSSQQTYDVTVTNRVGDPITVWMTKTLPSRDEKYEPGWTPPEVVAVGTTETEKLGGVAIEPGDTAHTVLKGTLAPNDAAVLRVYRATNLNGILAISRGNPDRLDIPLDPGKLDIDIVKKNGQMAAVTHGSATP
jgi:hypothetical protein